MKYKGIDISQWQTNLNYKAMAEDLDFVILREGYRKSQDSMFLTHLKGFQNAGVPVIGVYHFLYALNIDDAKAEAKSCIKNIEAAGMPKTTQIWCDFEYDTVESAAKKGVNLGPKECDAFTVAFCETVKSAGYPTGIYANNDYYENMYSEAVTSKYPLWLADLKEAPKYSCLIHQYSWRGRVSGYNDDLDAAMTTIEKAVSFMEMIANDDSHGYSQDYRWGPDYDCSSLTIEAWERAGVPVKTAGATYTGNMRAIFMNNGFIDVTNQINLSTMSGIKRGDVLLNEVHHVAVACGNGLEVEASINEKGGAHGSTPGDQTGKEILIRPLRNYPWDCILRYTGETSPNEILKKGSVGTAVINLQKSLITLGYSIEADGDFGAKTEAAVKDFQKKYNLEVDGIVGQQTRNKISEVIKPLTNPTPKTEEINSGKSSSNELKKGMRNSAVKALQQKLVELGYVITPDGRFGPNTDRIVREFQAKYNLLVDGIVGENTMDIINYLLAEKSIKDNIDLITDVSKPEIKYVGKVMANKLNVREGAGLNYNKVAAYPVLEKGNLVDVYDEIDAEDGSRWLYIRIGGKIFGYVSADYIAH